MKVLFIFVLVSIIMASCSSGKKQYMLVGTYTSGKSKGIYVYEFNGDDKKATLVDSITASNPSFLAISPNQKYVYAVNEDDVANGGG
ncbi:MAG: lactonase family protein, partial [Flavisolibacter sp.]